MAPTSAFRARWTVLVLATWNFDLEESPAGPRRAHALSKALIEYAEEVWQLFRLTRGVQDSSIIDTMQYRFQPLALGSTVYDRNVPVHNVDKLVHTLGTVLFDGMTERLNEICSTLDNVVEITTADLPALQQYVQSLHGTLIP